MTVNRTGLMSTVGSCHRRYLRLESSRRKTLPHTKRCPHGHRRHLDPLVHDHHSPEHAVRTATSTSASRVGALLIATASPPSTSSWAASVSPRSRESLCTVVHSKDRAWRLPRRWSMTLRIRPSQLLMRRRLLLRSLLRLFRGY